MLGTTVLRHFPQVWREEWVLRCSTPRSCTPQLAVRLGSDRTRCCCPIAPPEIQRLAAAAGLVEKDSDAKALRLPSRLG